MLLLMFLMRDLINISRLLNFKLYIYKSNSFSEDPYIVLDTRLSFVSIIAFLISFVFHIAAAWRGAVRRM